MSTTRNGLLGAAVVLLIMGGLFATGVVKWGSREDDAAPTTRGGDDAGTPRQRADRENLRSLAYLGEIPLADETRHRSGVHRNEPGASDGYILANPTGGGRHRGRPIREAGLWDAGGNKLHSWSSAMLSEKRPWDLARLDHDGYLYVILNKTALVKLDWESNVVWTIEGRFHHDFTIADDGSIVALVERKRIIDVPDGSTRDQTRAQLLEHGVAFIDPAGNPTGQVWMYDVMGDTPAFQKTLRRALRATGDAVIVEDEDEVDDTGARGPRALDVFHANSIFVLPHAVEGLGGAGDLLISLRNMNTVASFSRDTHEPIWVWGQSKLIRQHDATLTADGQVLLFDNRRKRDNSRAVLVDPVSSAIVRTIGGPGTKGALRFFSAGRGLAQALPGGNVMVVASNEGRILEVTPDDRVVWEFWSPWVANDMRKPIRAVRLEGEVQSSVAAIVTGDMSQPLTSPLPTKSVRFDALPPTQSRAVSPMGQATPVPPSPQ